MTLSLSVYSTVYVCEFSKSELHPIDDMRIFTTLREGLDNFFFFFLVINNQHAVHVHIPKNLDEIFEGKKTAAHCQLQGVLATASARETVHASWLRGRGERDGPCILAVASRRERRSGRRRGERDGLCILAAASGRERRSMHPIWELGAREAVHPCRLGWAKEKKMKRTTSARSIKVRPT